MHLFHFEWKCYLFILYSISFWFCDNFSLRDVHHSNTYINFGQVHLLRSCLSNVYFDRFLAFHLFVQTMSRQKIYYLWLLDTNLEILPDSPPVLITGDLKPCLTDIIWWQPSKKIIFCALKLSKHSISQLFFS